MKYWQGKWIVIKSLSQKEVLDLVPKFSSTPKAPTTVTRPPPTSKSGGEGKSPTYMEALHSPSKETQSQSPSKVTQSQSPSKVTQRKKKKRRRKSKSPQGINVGYS